MPFVIASIRMFLTYQARQPSDTLMEQDVLKAGVRTKRTVLNKREVN